jgi:hypothetical protein
VGGAEGLRVEEGGFGLVWLAKLSLDIHIFRYKICIIGYHEVNYEEAYKHCH